MQAPVDDDASEFVDNPLWHWQPVKIISECRYAVKLPFTHEMSGGV